MVDDWSITVTQVLAVVSPAFAQRLPSALSVPRYVPVDEAAREVGVARGTIYRYFRAGLLKKYRAKGVDRRTLVDIDELKELRRNPPVEPVD